MYTVPDALNPATLATIKVDVGSVMLYGALGEPALIRFVLMDV